MKSLTNCCSEYTFKYIKALWRSNKKLCQYCLKFNTSFCLTIFVEVRKNHYSPLNIWNLLNIVYISSLTLKMMGKQIPTNYLKITKIITFLLHVASFFFLLFSLSFDWLYNPFAKESIWAMLPVNCLLLLLLSYFFFFCSSSYFRFSFSIFFLFISPGDIKDCQKDNKSLRFSLSFRFKRHTVSQYKMSFGLSLACFLLFYHKFRAFCHSVLGCCFLLFCLCDYFQLVLQFILFYLGGFEFFLSVFFSQYFLVVVVAISFLISGCWGCCCFV